MSIYEHGYDVWNTLTGLIDGTYAVSDDVTAIIEELRGDATFNRLLEDGIIEEYLTWHDIGKPFCFSQDENGRWHFPEHATISADIWISANTKNGRLSYNDVIISYLMCHDLDLLIMKPSEADAYEITKFTPTQILCAFAAIYSNSGMFGGLESESFKIKKKKLLKSSQRIIRRMKENKNEQLL